LSGLRTFGVMDQLVKKMIKISDEHLKNDKNKKDKYKKYFNHLLDVNPVMVNDVRIDYDLFKK